MPTCTRLPDKLFETSGADLVTQLVGYLPLMMECWDPIPVAPLWMQFPANTPGSAVGNGPSAGLPATHVQNPDPGSSLTQPLLYLRNEPTDGKISLGTLFFK